MSFKNLVSLVVIIFFVCSAAYGSETFLENRVSLLQSATNQQSAPSRFSTVENSFAPLLKNTTVSNSQGIDNDKDVPISMVFFNPCNDENVNVSGKAHIVVNRNVIHYFVSDMTATGLETGNSYAGRGTSVQTITFYSNPFEGTFNFRLNLNSENGDGFVLKLLFHLTVNEIGEITSEVESARVACR